MIRRALLAATFGTLGSAAVAAPAHLPASAQVAVPTPPLASGNAPQGVLTAPIAPDSGPAQSVAVGSAATDAWWQAFGSPALDTLVSRALAANNDLAAANANLAQAHQLSAAAHGGLFPQVDGGYTANRQRLSQSLSSPLNDPAPTVFSLHTAQVSVTYSPDLFGGGTARVRSVRAAEKVAAARAAGVRNMVSGNVVVAVIQNAALGGQIDAARSAIASNREILGMLRAREVIGAIGKADVAAQEAALAAAEAALPPLERAQRANLAALSVLVGVAPGAELPDLPALDAITLPQQLPLSLPSDLLAARPDVVAAAATLEGAAYDVRAALAARLPSFSLSATAGGSAVDFGRMFSNGNPFWSLIGGVTVPIFHAGALRHQHKAAQAALEAAKANYRGTALQSFADVSNALTALVTDADALDAARRGETAAGASLAFIRRQLELGGVGTLAVLNASTAAQQARSQAIAARAMRLTDTAALFTALGGGQLAPVKAAAAEPPQQDR